MITRRVGMGVLAALVLLAWTGGAGASGMIFSDDFEGWPVGNYAPPGVTWSSYPSTPPAGNSLTIDTTASQGLKSLKVVAVPGTNMGVDSVISGAPTLYTIFVSASVRMDSDNATNGAYLYFFDGSGNIYAGLLFSPTVGSGKYTVKVLRNGGTSTILSNVAIGPWEKWVFGVQITDNSTGDGLYTVYRNGTAIVTNGAMTKPFSSACRNVTKVRCAGDLAAWHLDDVKIYDTVIGGILPGTLTGQVTLENYSDNLTLTPISIQLRQSGSLVKTLTASLDSGGNYSVLSGVTPGTYDLAFKGACWLQKVVPGVVIPADTPPAAVNVTLLGGDVDGSNAVDSTDLSALLMNMDAAGQ